MKAEIQLTVEDLIALKAYYEKRQLEVGGNYYRDKIYKIEKLLDNLID